MTLEFGLGLLFFNSIVCITGVLIWHHFYMKHLKRKKERELEEIERKKGPFNFI